MAEVTVNITANASGAINDLNNAANRSGVGNNILSSPLPNSPSSSGGGLNNPPINSNGNTPVIPTYDRMAQDIRREILSRGALMVPGQANFNQIMQTVQQQQRTAAYNSIDDKYQKKYEDLEAEKNLREKAIVDEVEFKRQDRLSRSNDPFNRTIINQDADKELKRRLSKLGAEYYPQFEGIEKEHNAEKSKVDQDLVKIANELVQELKKSGGSNPNSYLGKLRGQYREAISRRDNAETEGEAQAASKEAAEIQKRIMRGMTPDSRIRRTFDILGGVNQMVGVINQGVDAWRHNNLHQISELGAAANGDMFGAMAEDLERRRANALAIGGIAGSIVGTGAGAYFGGGFGAAAGGGIGGSLGTGIANWIFSWMHAAEEANIKLGQMWQQQESRVQQFNELALVTRGQRGEELSREREYWMNYLISTTNSQSPNSRLPYDEQTLDFHDLGYTSNQFSAIIAQRAKQRGFYEDRGWNTFQGLTDYAVNQVALERAYNMSEGSLAQLSSYDRYGNNANQDMANLIASLRNRSVLGMSGGQTLRANEFLGYQTQLMEMQKGWMDAPNAKYATRLLLAAQNAYGNNFDSRAINEIGQIENTVTNPKEDYSKALLYDVIQEVMPNTKGDLLAIKKAQYSDDPAVRMKIQQAMAKRIQEVYGGLDTTSGYIAASHYYGIQDPERLKKIVSQYEQGLPEVVTGDVNADAATLKGYTPEVSKTMLQYQDSTVLEISSKLSGLISIGEQMNKDFIEKLDALILEFKKV